MITLYRVAECAACDEVQTALRELVVAHKVVDVERENTAKVAEMLANRQLPVIADGDALVSGDAEIHAYLAELTGELEQWRKFQTDACYIDDKGQTC
jgi:glutaredoxin